MSENEEGKRKRNSGNDSSEGTPNKLRTTAKKLGATPGKKGQQDIRDFLSPTNSTGQPNENEMEQNDRQSTRRNDACVRRLDQDFNAADHEDDKPVEPRSIHRILVDRIRLPPPPKKVQNQNLGIPFNAEKKKIEKIIDTYNASIKKKSKENGDQSYNEDKGVEQLKLSSKLSDLMDQREPFRTCVYIRKSESQTDFIRLYTSKPAENMACNIHSVIFFYRQDEIYALPSNTAWRVVHDFADFDFPMTIAARLCCNEGPIQTEVKNLIGPVVHGKKTTKTGHYSSENDPPILCLNYTGKLRQDASIKKIPSMRDDINIEFGFAYVRIKKPLIMSHCNLILDHFSLIVKGGTTYKYLPGAEDGNLDVEVERREEHPTTAYDHSLTKVHPTLLRDLNLQLCQHIVDAFKKKWSAALGFDLEHKHVEQFALSAKVDLIYKKAVIELPTHPTLKDVVDAISEKKVPKDISNLLKLTNKSLHKVMKRGEVKIRFEDAQGIKRHENLLGLLEGEMIYDGRVYWRVMKLWCNLKLSYPLTIHEWFINFLSKHLIENLPEEQQYMRLKKKWPHLQSLKTKRDADVVKHYVSQYEGEEGFYLPLEEDSGLFDLMYVKQLDGRLSIVLYFIVPNFATDTSSVCSRIYRCKKAFETPMNPAENDQEPPKGQGPFWTFYEHQKEKSALISQYSFDVFRGFLGKSKIVFVLSRAQPQWEMTLGPRDAKTETDEFKPTLCRESQLSLSITEDDIQTLLEGDKCPLDGNDMVKLSEENGHSAGMIHRAIKTSQYISRDDTITVEFHYSNERNFLYNSPYIKEDNLRKKLYRLLRHFQSGYRSLRAKLEIRETDRYVRNTQENEFFIDEIEEESEEDQNGDLKENQDDQNGGERQNGDESSQIEDDIMEQEEEVMDIEESD